MSFSFLGKGVDYSRTFGPDTLNEIPRDKARKGECAGILFSGFDIWKCYEVSYLDRQLARPVSLIGQIKFQSDSPYLIESKSLKLYLNSFAMQWFENEESFRQQIAEDLSRKAGVQTEVVFYSADIKPADFPFPNQEDFFCLEERVSLADGDGDQQIGEPFFLQFQTGGHARLLQEGDEKSFKLYSRLLRTNCPVTGQPDWGTIYVQFESEKGLSLKSLLLYLLSFRIRQHFHESTVELIYSDLMRSFTPQRLAVLAAYTRRGGMDISSVRWNSPVEVSPFFKTARQ